MGEAKRRDQAAQAAGHAPKEPLQLSASESARILELQTRAEAARAVFVWAQQQAEAAQQAWHREMIQVLEEHEIEVPEEEGAWRWNHRPTKRELLWRFTPAHPPPAAPPQALPAPDTTPGATTEVPSAP